MKFPFWMALLLVAFFFPCFGCSTAPHLTLSDLNSPEELALGKIGIELAQTDRNLHSLLVEYKGKLVIELYKSGWDTQLSNGGGVLNLWSDHGANMIHDVRSTTKSVVALLAGIVLAKHPQYSVRSMISDFPLLSRTAPPGAQSIELGHLLGMTSGLSWKEWGRGIFESDETPLNWEADPVKYYLNRPAASLPGEVFNYSGGSTFAASRILELIDGRDIAEIAKKELFEPLGIGEWKWGKGLNGITLPNSGLGLTSKDMLKIGKLMISMGQWGGIQIVPASWVTEVTNPKMPVPTDYFNLDNRGTMYGFSWWTGSVQWMESSSPWYSTVGNGGQKIFVFPQGELIVIMTAGDYGSPDIQKWETSVLKSILKAINLRKQDSRAISASSPAGASGKDS